MPIDPNFSNVVLLCHFDGGLTDVSLSNHTLTFFGTSSINIFEHKFGTGSLNIGGSSASATTVDSPDWDFGSGQFTVEAWFKANAAPTTVQSIVSQYSSGTGQLAWFLGFNISVLSFYYSTTGSNQPFVGASVSITPGTWYHIAVDRDASSVLRVYLNGTVVASATVAATFFNSNLDLRIGSDGSNTRALQGQIDEVRITKGLARYAGAFTPQTEEFPTGTFSTLVAQGLVREVIGAPGVGSNRLIVQGLVREVIGVPGVAVGSTSKQYAVTVIT